MPRLICPTFWGQYTHEATCMPRQHQDSLLDAARQGEEGMMPNKRSLLKLVVICATVISLAWITRSTLCELRIRSGTTEVAAILAYESER